MSSLQYRLLIGAGVPFILALLGVMGKRLSRGSSGGWIRDDFYLGVEFTLSGVSVALLNLFELLGKPNRQPQPSDNRLLLVNVVTAFIGLVLFMFVLTMHQDYEGNVTKGRTKEVVMLGCVSNMIGFAVLLASVVSMPV